VDISESQIKLQFFSERTKTGDYDKVRHSVRKTKLKLKRVAQFSAADSRTEQAEKPNCTWAAAARVTRLGEFLPIWRLFTLSSLFKITMEDLMLGLLLSAENIM
jgi:hypothetical protein